MCTRLAGDSLRRSQTVSTPSRILRSAVAAMISIGLVLASSSFAATVTKLNDDVFAPLRGTVMTRNIRIDKLPLLEARNSIIELQEFQVWAPGAKVIIHGDGGAVTKQDPPPMRFFRGLVNGDPESFAYFSVDAAGHVYGLVATKDHRYAVTAQRRPGGGAREHVAPGETRVDSYDHFLTTADPNDEIAPGKTWECVNDKYKMTPDVVNSEPIRAGTDSLARPNVALTGTQQYSITVEIQTDFEFYTDAGSSTSAATTYITNLSGAVSTIYSRDLHTNVVQGNVNIYTTSSDPWSATDPATGLDELGDYYHSTATRTTSEVVMLSGKTIAGGIAWEGTVCGTDLLQGGHWAGPYAWCGGVGNLFGSTGLGTIPDPNSTQNSVLYGMPAGIQNYWPLAEYAHEMGHNLAGHHTHCVAITDAERIAAGFTDGSPATSASDFVDHCYATEGTGCFSGTNYVAGSESVFNGTIMSYCHNVFSGSFPQSRFIFGLASEPSHHELDDYMLSATGPGANGGTRNIVTGTTASLSAITAPASLVASSTGNSASVTNVGGQTYAWTITNGSITAGASTNAITFTAGASGSVTLKVTVVNSTMCSVTDSKSVSISSTTYNPPTNVLATAVTATSVGLTWSAPSGTAPGRYNVYRSADGVSYGSSIGNTTGLAFTDNKASADTAYLYKVRSAAADGTNESADSNRDLATTVIFTDDPLVVGSTALKAVHITQLRTAVNAARKLANGGVANDFSFTDPTLTAQSTQVKRIHIIDLRTALDAARSTLSLTALTYADTTITIGSTVIKATHLTDLRNGVK